MRPAFRRLRLLPGFVACVSQRLPPLSLLAFEYSATFCCEQVWGRDEDGGLSFTQKDINKMVETGFDLRGPLANVLPLTETYAQSLVNLAVSDANKRLLINAPGFAPMVIDLLLLDSDHPIRKDPNFDRAAPLLQRVS